MIWKRDPVTGKLYAEQPELQEYTIVVRRAEKSQVVSQPEQVARVGRQVGSLPKKQEQELEDDGNETDKTDGRR